ncbi:MAG: DNA recombination protein RmuC [Ignavibacteriaceae bacterium]|nr:DNA recombination protein RmuC [Ignavibacteriaceae bacterium]
MEIIYGAAAGIILGGIIAWLILKVRDGADKGISKEEAAVLNDQINNLKIERSAVQERINILQENLKTATQELTLERNKFLQLNSTYSSLKSDFTNLEDKLSTQKEEVEQLQQKFAIEFKNLANEILEDKSKRFTEQNKVNINELLNPLSEKIKSFEKKVEDVYLNDTKERAGLTEQIKMLHELNQQMSKDANNLTKALKGEAKTQGNWGEFILERVLEKSGLVKGQEYVVQESVTDEDGKRLQPDVVIYLPESKCIIIDSKVSLVGYERYCSADDELIRGSALKEHISSIKKHITNLSAKNYQNMYGVKSLDFVLLFMPIEPAFSLAVQNDMGLFNDAFERNIVIVSPSTLLATLRTIASIWRQENQNHNALEIARQSGALYDKFQNMVIDLLEVGRKLHSVQDNYDEVMKKLSTGKGNLITSVEKIKKLGAKTTKSLPQGMADRVDETEEVEVQV